VLNRRQYIASMCVAGIGILADRSIAPLQLPFLQFITRPEADSVQQPLCGRRLPKPITFPKTGRSHHSLELNGLYSPSVSLQEFFSTMAYRHWTQTDLLIGVLDGRLDRRVLVPGWLREEFASSCNWEKDITLKDDMVTSHELRRSFAIRGGSGVFASSIGDSLQVNFTPPLQALVNHCETYSRFKPSPTIVSILFTSLYVNVLCSNVPNENDTTLLRISLSTARQRLKCESEAMSPHLSCGRQNG
jgi:hypothetical protein